MKEQIPCIYLSEWRTMIHGHVQYEVDGMSRVHESNHVDKNLHPDWQDSEVEFMEPLGPYPSVRMKYADPIYQDRRRDAKDIANLKEEVTFKLHEDIGN